MLISSNNNSNYSSKESSAQRKQRRRQRMVRKANATHSSSSSMSMRAVKEIYKHTHTHTHALTHSQALLACINTYKTRSITLTHTHTRTHADDASQQQRSDFMQNIPNCFMRFVRHFVVVLATSGQQQRQRQRRRRLLRAPALAVCMYCTHICGRLLSHFLSLSLLLLRWNLFAVTSLRTQKCVYIA